ncbi:uncharacterized protein KIAA1755 homolog isoform X2 [Elgaria multicarinata webbii]|uniref:uncharacterized protein KIAA1755 homolog isoform X2 n=1 Tax=Elgaria multicarinata webbii TaxID=159646 RepID=UPI002FCCEAFF
MDPQSLDAAVQNTLSGLFPPFDITAPTVLSQLFRVLEARYHGDGLCCLLDFLIPSKRLLEHVRQAACAPYFNRVFLHEGWPLCLHEKVAVHLSPLNPLLLRPGDFYLQAEPCGEQSACLVVKCLSRDLTTVEKIPIPEASCSLLFTKEWLEEINRDLDRPMLHTCLVATGNGIVPVPWSKIATPEFVEIAKTEGLVEPESSDSSETCCKLNSQRQDCHLAGDERRSPNGSLGPSHSKYPGLIKVDQGSWKKSTLFVLPSLCDIISENLEGEYVNLLEFSEGKKPDFSSPAKSTTLAAQQQQPQGEASPRTNKGLVWVDGDDGAATENWSCGKGPNAEEGPCTPCLRRKLNQDPKVHEPRCRYRESYVAALKNPVSFSSGLMAAILEEIDVAKQASSSESTAIQPPEGSDQAAPRILSGHPNKDEKVEEAPKLSPLRLQKSPAECPAASNKFSFLKGHRQPSSSGGGFSGPEKAGKRQEGPRKRTLMVCSPRAARAKPAAATGKGTSQADAMFSELPTPKVMESTTMSPTDALLKECLLPGSGTQELVRWESLSPELLSSGIVCLPGNTDKLGRPVVQITTNGGGAWQAPWCSAREVTRLLLYLLSLTRKQSNDPGLTVVIDARKQPPSLTLSAALGSIQALPGSFHAVLLLAEKEAASHLEKLPGVQVELLSSLKALGRHVDSSQLTQALDGHFPYCHSEWVQFFQKMHHFVSDLTKASELLRSTTQELEQGDAPETVQAVEQQMDRHRQLMQDVLCNAQLVSLQREGGALLARLRKEAARLGFPPGVRNSITCALGLYNLVEEEVHTLVSKSNHRLEHLEFLLKIRELEAEFSKLSSWFDEQGEPELRAVGSAEDSQETTEESYRRFKEFFKEATVHYNHGLSLSKEAARVQGSKFPETGAFEAAKGAFQAKLTTFYMDMEMRGAELETSLDLYRFCDKVTQFNRDCKQCLPRWTAGANEPKSTEAREEVENSLQRLSEEFSDEKFQQMKMQAASMRNKNGLVVWREALERCQESKEILEETLAVCKEVLDGNAKDCGEKTTPFVPDPNPSSRLPGDDLCFDGASGKPKKEEELPEGNRRHEVGAVDNTSVCDSRSQEVPLCGGTGQAGEGSGEAYLDATLAQDLDEEAAESLHPTTQNPAWTLPAPTSPPNVTQVPGGCENPPSAKPPCASVPARGHRSRKREAAQYFQLSRHGSFSSEDTDSQNSTEDALGSSATLPMESPGPKGAWTQERVQGIIYLENHNTNSLGHAATQ